ncbi:pyridoxamine 5'-phosphate oxidase family protein [Thermodesulfobacteriota bacterium]
MSRELMEFFNKQPRLGTLSTADKNGKVNSAYFGSPRMTDEKTIVMGCGKNRTFDNLQENSQAVFLVMEPGKALADWKGVRINVKMIDCDTSGEAYKAVVAAIAEKVGKEAADKMIHAALTFEIDEIRPLVEMGQGWQKSIQ